MPRRAIAALLLAFALSSVACTMWKQPQHPTFKTATAIEDLERLMWKSVQQGDWKQVSDHLAPTFVQVSPAGRRDRDATLQHFQQVKLESFSIGEAQTQPSGEAMVITYTLELRGSSAGRPITTAPLHVMTVWQTVKNGWVEIAQSVAPAPPAQ